MAAVFCPGNRTKAMSLNAVISCPPMTASTARRGSVVNSWLSTADSASVRSGHVDLGQESELAEVHPEDRGPLPVGKPHGTQHRAVSAQAHQQVRPLSKFGGGHRLGGAG